MNSLTALVTGSTAGIGLGIAKTLAGRGSNIILTGLGSQEAVNKCLTEVKNAGSDKVSVQFVGGDLRNLEGIHSMCGEALRLHPQGIDILVNNAGMYKQSPLENYTLETWNDIISVNLTAPFLFIKHLLPQMKLKNWGRIVNISSVHGMIGHVEKAPYTASKHGLIGLTKTVALETARTGITCNAVCPGMVTTERKERKESLVQRFPSRKPVSIEEVAELVAYLCSPAAEQIRGAAIPIDGGWVVQ